VVNRGEIWWLEQPEVGRRPVCVLTRQAAIPVLEAVVVAPATRAVREIPTEVVLERDDGLPERCALSFDNLRTVRKGLLTERITRLAPARLEEACRALAVATGC
jgi:mRNA interferase MazF